MTRIIIILISAILSLSGVAQADVSPEVKAIQAEWARIKYQVPESQREEAFVVLAKQAGKVSEAQPGKAEPLVWQAIVLASAAGEKGGLGALGLVKQAHELLLQAESLDPKVMEGSVYTSLGSLYYQVPGWPIGFGDDDKAREYLEKALAINPNGLDANFFYAGFLADQGDKQGALKAYERAMQAPGRPDRPVADEGRRHEIEQQIALLKGSS